MPHNFEYVGGAAMWRRHEEDRWRLYHEACTPNDGGWYNERSFARCSSRACAEPVNDFETLAIAIY